MPSKVESPVSKTTQTNKSDVLSTKDHDLLIDRLLTSIHSRSVLAGKPYPLAMGGLNQASPPRRGNSPKRFAVALDCEMARTEDGPECVQLCAVDVLTGDVLLDIGVIPIPRVINWQTRWSGMNWAKMKQMRAEGRTVRGWRAARKALFEFVDQETILVGHSLDNDLKTLYLVHQRVVDTALVTRAAVEEVLGGGCGRKWALRRLAEAFLGVRIQASSKGHDCVEDTVTTRKVLLKCLLEPEVLKKWAVQAAADEGVRGGQVIADTKGYDEVEEFL